MYSLLISRRYTIEINSIDNIVRRAFCFKCKRASVTREVYFQLAKREVTIGLEKWDELKIKTKKKRELISLETRSAWKCLISIYTIRQPVPDEMYFNDT